MTNNQNPKYPLEDPTVVADGIRLEGWTTTGQDRAWQSASVMQDCKCLEGVVARKWVVSVPRWLSELYLADFENTEGAASEQSSARS